MNNPQTYSWIFWIVIIAIFYFILIMPERKRQKKMKEMIDSLKVGNEIITRGGVIGKIINISGDTIVITTSPENTKIELTKYAVNSLSEKEMEKKKEEDKSNKEEAKKKKRSSRQ